MKNVQRKSLLCAMALILFVFTACGSGSTTSRTIGYIPKVLEDESEPSFIRAQLGPLSEATVTVYKIEDNGSKTLLFTETSTDGTDFTEVGYFDSHVDELEENVYYLYEISGGEDVDANDNGVVDDTPTQNNGKIRLIVKGSDLENSARQVRATVLSELVYVYAKATLKNDLPTLNVTLNDLAKGFLSADINGDNIIDYRDILAYDPVSDKDKLSIQYSESKLASIIAKIHANDLSYLLDLTEPVLASYGVTQGSSFVLSQDEKIAYISSDDGLEKLNIEDINNIVQLDINASIPNARKLILSPDGSTLYVAQVYTQTSVLIIDTATMQVVGEQSYDAYIGFMQLSDDANTLFIASGHSSYYDKVGVYDVSNRSLPSFITDVTGSFTHLDDFTLNTDSTRLLVSDYDGALVYFDISDLANVTQLDYVAFADTHVRIALLSQDNNYAYFYETRSDELGVYDLINKTIVGSTYVGNAKTIIFSSDESSIFVNTGIAITEVDISDVNNINVVSSVSSTNEIKEMSFSDDDRLVYILTPSEFSVLNMSTSAVNSFTSTYPIVNNNSRSLTLSSDDRYAYIGTSKGLEIHDLQTKTTLFSNSGSASTIYDIALDEDQSKIYARQYDKLYAYNISDESNPVQKSENNDLDRVQGLHLSAYKNKVFTADKDNQTLFVLKTSLLDSTRNATSEEIVTAGSPQDVITSNDDKTVFVAMDTGLEIFSYTDFENMGARDEKFVSLSTETTYIGLKKLVYIQEKKLLIAGTTSKVIVYDVNDTANPQVLSTYDGYAVDMTLSNDQSKIYVTDESKISLIDVRDPSNLTKVFTFSTGGFIKDIKESSDSKTLFALTAGSILKYDLNSLNELRGEIAPLAQDLNITSTLRSATFSLIGSDEDSQDSALEYIITKPAVIVGSTSTPPTLTCIGSDCTLVPNDEYYAAYQFSYKVFDGSSYSNEARVQVDVAEYFGFSGVVDSIDIESPDITKSRSVNFSNPNSENFTISTNTHPKLEITTEILTQTKIRVTARVLDTSSNISFTLKVNVHSQSSEQNSTKSLFVNYSSGGAV